MDKTFTIAGNTYLIRNPAAYGTDVMTREVRKKYYLSIYPEDRTAPREEFRERYSAWMNEIDGSVLDAALTLRAILIPQPNADGTIAPEIGEATIEQALSWEIDAPLNFFSNERLRAYLSYEQSKTPGIPSTESIGVTNSEGATPSTTTDPTTGNTSPENTKIGSI